MSALAAYEAQRTANAALVRALEEYVPVNHPAAHPSPGYAPPSPPTYTPPPRQEPVEPREVLIDPAAFQAGADAAYDRVLAFLDALPEQSATRTRDHGRGLSHTVREIRQAVLTLRDDC